MRHSEAQSKAELGQVAPRAINQAQTGTGAGTEAAALSVVRFMCAFVVHIIKARESGREAPKRSKDS